MGLGEGDELSLRPRGPCKDHSLEGLWTSGISAQERECRQHLYEQEVTEAPGIEETAWGETKLSYRDRHPGGRPL